MVQNREGGRWGTPKCPSATSKEAVAEVRRVPDFSI